MPLTVHDSVTLFIDIFPVLIKKLSYRGCNFLQRSEFDSKWSSYLHIPCYLPRTQLPTLGRDTVDN